MGRGEPKLWQPQGLSRDNRSLRHQESQWQLARRADFKGVAPRDFFLLLVFESLVRVGSYSSFFINGRLFSAGCPQVYRKPLLFFTTNEPFKMNQRHSDSGWNFHIYLGISCSVAKNALVEFLYLLIIITCILIEKSMWNGHDKT